MLVHRKRQRRGAAAVTKAANETANLVIGKAVAPEFLRHKGRKQFRVPDVSVVLGDETVGAVVCGGPLSECRAERGNDLFPIGKGHGPPSHAHAALKDSVINSHPALTIDARQVQWSARKLLQDVVDRGNSHRWYGSSRPAMRKQSATTEKSRQCRAIGEPWARVLFGAAARLDEE